MWFSLARLALKTGSEVYKNRKETKVLQSIAERKQMQRVIDGEIEMVNTVKTHQANDWKDEIVGFDGFTSQLKLILDQYKTNLFWEGIK